MILALLPLFNLILEGIHGLQTGSVNLGLDGPRQIKGTFLLLTLTSLIGGFIGTVNGWLLANCRFHG